MSLYCILGCVGCFMLRGTLVVVVLGLATLISFDSTLAQNAAGNDAAARRIVVPYVRAATDCLATAMRADRGFIAAAIADDLNPLRSNAVKACGDALARMLQAHDTAYYNGKGVEFLKGPYAEDLDRALRTRLGAEMVQIRVRYIEAQQKQQQEQTERKAAADRLIEKAYECAFTEAGTMIASSEKSEIVANAAISLCGSVVNSAINALIQAYKADDERTFRLDLEKVFREKVLANIVKARAIAETGTKNSQPAPSLSTGKQF